MEKQLIILGNMKMNMTYQEILPYLKQLKKIAKHTTSTVGIAVPYVYLPYANHILMRSNVLFGAQNCSQYEKGAHTGEISTNMLLDFSCQFCLVGHSERRAMGETDQIVAEKVKALLDDGIVPVLCVGENLEERKKGVVEKVLKQQLTLALGDLTEQEMKNIVIAYEPIWAIGTGETATTEQIESTILMIKKILADLLQSSGAIPSVLYGGSVKASNIQTIVDIDCVDGVLVGGACLSIEDFAPIVQCEIKKED